MRTQGQLQRALARVGGIDIRARGMAVGPRWVDRAIPGSRKLGSDGVWLRREAGRPAFNFRQIVWIYPGVGMDWHSHPTREVETLAANILLRFIPKSAPERRAWVEAVLSPRPRSESVVWQFVIQVLVRLPEEGSQLDASFVRGWLALHMALLRRRARRAEGSTAGRARPWLRPAQTLE
jgi:hypothetical protein